MRVSPLQNLKSFLDKLFSIRIVDEHYVIRLLGMKFCKKFPYEYEYKDAQSSGITTEKRTPRVIVSLTTFPARINIVHKTISTILEQTVKPDEVVLWLAEEQFPSKELPQTLTRLQEFGLSIKWCDDIKSFKKLVPSLKEYPDDIIITVDDDYYYDENLIKTLLEEHKKYPDCIISSRAMRIVLHKNRKHTLIRRSYVYDNTYLPSYKNFFIGFGGVLYPPHCLHKDVTNKDMFTKIIPTNDDAWFWLNAVRNKTKIVPCKDGYKLKFYTIENSQEIGLYKINCNNSTRGITGEEAVNMFMGKMFPEIKDPIFTDN